MSPVLKLKMRFTMKALRASRTAAAGFTVLVVANAAGCAEGSNPTRDLFTAVGAGPKVAATPDFVAAQNEAAGKAAAQLGGTPAPQPVPLPKAR